jgi:tRNA splicing ligase
VLDANSQDKVLSMVPAFQDPAKKFGHHVTLAFRPSQEHVDNLEFAKRVNFKVKTIAMDEYCIAVEVELPEDVKSNNEHPHVTICTREGISPVYSNQMLERAARGNGTDGITVYPIENMELSGIITCEMKS